MTVGSQDASVRQHVLLTVLGVKPTPAQYTLNDRDTEQLLAPVALFNLLEDSEQPELVLALCTPEAKEQSWPLLERALKSKCRVKSVDVSGSDSKRGSTAT